MKVKVILPSEILLELEAVKVVAEAQNGSFCILPRHVDFVATLIPGILAVTSAGGAESFLAVDEGVLVKCGAEVLVSTREAVPGPLGELKEAVRRRFQERGAREQTARTALGKLEANLVRQILEWEERGHA